MNPFWRGFPGWINRTDYSASCRSIAMDLAINSHPLSLCRQRGTAPFVTSLPRTILNVFALIRVDASRARHSHANFSMMLRIRSLVPFRHLSWMMPIVQIKFCICAAYRTGVPVRLFWQRLTPPKRYSFQRRYVLVILMTGNTLSSKQCSIR